MIVKDEAVVLRGLKYGDTSKIVTLYTRDHGRVTVLAKGARARNAKYGSALEPGSRILAVYYSKETREIQTLSQADVIEPFRVVASSLPSLAAALQMLEVVYDISFSGHPHREVHDLLVDGLRTLDKVSEGLPQVLIGFRLHVASSLGFAPSLYGCIRCGSPIEPEDGTMVRFHIPRGGPMCKRCFGEIREQRGQTAAEGFWTDHVIHVRTLTALKELMTVPLVESHTVACDHDTRNELESTLRLYERFHVERSRPLRTAALVRDVVV
ncbi:MAG: DNA repair protein RecO [Ignavibacteria bacterium RIFCSPLOWO2_02_FULL_55_14]|nr:MAG: DNA repair protein RecO [Ignavibacteria bacterium RIFCSPHIGHO2_02_FULL_56_12]OGU68904.1 MAG: DNA repair protein RecO [Ignavibacteria bacterium RIFCSPLOWO2_02_FULL_55_14]OGU76297.1 MAG: DNA repair protein RecO [Ignavibacteria bacterium RIFCSPLOWO2_12_FULL_56_21]